MTVFTNENNTPDVVAGTGNSSRPMVGKRISWSSVIAGVLMALIIQIAMNILGLAIGSAILDPDSPRNALGPTFSTGAVVWIGVSILLSLFVGGYVAARLSSTVNRFDAVLHGLLVWALATLAGFTLMWGTASSIISGVSNLVGEGVSMLGMTAAEAAPQVADALDMQDMVYTSINEQAGRTGVAPDAPNNSALMLAMSSLLRAEPDSTEANDARSNAIAVLTSQGMSDTEANNLVTNWETQYRQAADEAKRLAAEAADNLAEATAVTSGMLFLMMVLGAFAGGSGGYAGRPRRLRVVPTNAVPTTS